MATVGVVKEAITNVKHLRPIKKPHYVPQPITKVTNSDKEKHQKSKCKCFGQKYRKPKVKNEDSDAKNRQYKRENLEILEVESQEVRQGPV